MSKSTMNSKPSDGLFVLFKGESGMGKTVGALSFPEPYVFDFDKKMPNIARKHFPDKDIRYDTFDFFQEVVEKVNEFYQDCPYDTLIVDSYTFLCSLVMESVGQIKGDSVPQMLQRVNETKKGKMKTIEPMSMEYYTGEVRFTEWFMDKLKTLVARPGKPRYVIVNAHVLKIESAPNPMKDGLVTTTRDIVSKGRKAGQQLPAGFDDVYLFAFDQPNAFAGETKVRRVCITECYGEDTAKCSLNIPARIDFTNDSLYDKIFRRAEFPHA